MEISGSIIELVDVGLSGYDGKTIFEGLNLSLPEGKTAVISGPTGAGKSQLVKLIIGDLSPNSGSVFVFGQFIKKNKYWQLANIRKKIGGVGGVFNLISYQTVYENLLHPLILNKKPVSFQKSKIEQVLSRFELIGKRNEQAGLLSQGEKIETMLARAIIADQPLLLIDEPLAGVDDKIAEKIKQLLVRLSMAGHSMVILTSNPDRLGIPDALNFRFKNGALI
ncbi:MAG: ATP-binding cassette domain-containing protein [candidate division Zixibacteria bacterium]|nr:ATP-binding cassette domain-containing protein [candidate division Zixibacteria bacterium]